MAVSRSFLVNGRAQLEGVLDGVGASREQRTDAVCEFAVGDAEVGGSGGGDVKADRLGDADG